MFSKILVANWGEIAVRIIRACKEMGIATVAVYSQADRDALHVALAEESCCIGRAVAADSYLNEERILSAALATGAAAIHPGYGFLSENAHFAALCQKNGIVFIGPSPETMERLSDKSTIKRLMAEAGLPIIPGTGVLSGGALALAVADRVWMLENAIYSVISPEGCASILWKDPQKADIAAENLKITASDALTLSVIERMIKEDDLGQPSFYARTRELLTAELAVLEKNDHLLEDRYARFRRIGKGI